MPTPDTSERELLAAVDDLAAALDAQRDVFRTYLDRLRRMEDAAYDPIVLEGMRSIPGVVTGRASPAFKRLHDAALRLTVEASMLRKTAARVAFKLKGEDGHG